MNRGDVARLLTLAASFDARTIGEADVIAWDAALSGLDYDRCRAAVVKHYQESTDRVMPAHVRRLARTTTDLHHGTVHGPVAGELCEQGSLCGDCKLVHRPDEPCSVLIADDALWRKALNLRFRLPELPAEPS